MTSFKQSVMFRLDAQNGTRRALYAKNILKYSYRALRYSSKSSRGYP